MGEWVLRQAFRYEYTTPARRLRHRLMAVPRAAHGSQVLLDHRVTVNGARATKRARTDGFGNHVVEIRADRVDEVLELEVYALVALEGPCGVAPAPPTVGGRWSAAHRPLTEPDDLLSSVAGQLRQAHGGGLAFAEAANAWTASALSYAYGSTTVSTTAAEAIAAGSGVCQDYAHVMLSLCRAAGVPARYVSGHLVGEGGSHAWVEVIVGSLAVAFDPTNDRRARGDYVTVAVGRDYADVPPTSGHFRGDSPGLLSATKSLEPVVAVSRDNALA